MSVLDDLANAILDVAETVGVEPVELVELLDGVTEPNDIAILITALIQANGEVVEPLIDTVDESLLAEIEAKAPVEPDEAENMTDDLQGVAGAFLGGILAVSYTIESLPLDDFEVSNEMLFDIVAMFNFDMFVGREVEAWLQEGVDPALKQAIHRQARSKQADFKDFTEANARSRLFGADIETRTSDIPDDIKDFYAPSDFGWLTDPDTYGTIPDQTDLYEYVALEHLEPEEIVEEAPQFGTVPSRAAMEQVVRTSTLPRDVQQVYLDLFENIPKSQNLLQEAIRLEQPLQVIDQAVFEDRLTPEQAVSLVAGDVDAYIQVSDAEGNPIGDGVTQDEVVNTVLAELLARWQLIHSVPNDAPTRGQIERWFRNGVITAQRFLELNDQFGILPAFFSEMLVDNAIRQGADDVAKQFILGRLGAVEARFRLGLIGYTNDQAARILAGADPDTVVQDAFAAQAEDAQQPVGLAVEIGDSRGAQLRAVGIESLSDLAQASVEDLTSVTGMSDTEATRAIQSAQQILSQAAQSGS